MAEEKRKNRRKRNTNSWAWSRAVARTDFVDLQLQRGFRAGQFWPSLTHQQDRWSHFISGSGHCLFTAIEKVSTKKKRKVLFLNTVPETSNCYTATAGLASGVCVVQGQQWLTHTLRHSSVCAQNASCSTKEPSHFLPSLARKVAQSI